MRTRAPERMVVADLDGTLLGDDAALREFAEAWRRAAGRVLLVYSSGRFVASMRDSVARTALPAPDWYVGGVGSQIESAAGRALAGWEPLLRAGWDRGEALAALRRHPAIELQPDDCQGPYKVSGWWRGATAGELARLGDELAARSLRCRVVYSSDRDVDLLPAAAGKGASALHLARQLAIPLERVICCGDSGNDADLFAAGFGAGIVVGNAAPELRAAAGGAYRARASFAAGVLEGLRELGVLPKE